jgi:cyclin-dependent kinase 12/13
MSKRLRTLRPYNGKFVYHMKKVLYKDKDSDSIVYAAKQQPGSLSVAVKMVKSYPGIFDSEISITRSVSKLEHVLPLIDAYLMIDYYVLVTPLMVQTLYKFKGIVTEELCKRWMFQLLTALEKCHSIGIVHRDVKSENLFLDDLNNIWLADFGIATQIMPNSQYDMTANTLWYRPPEVMLTDNIYTEKVDIWATGCVFYEMLHRKVLFTNETEKGILRSQFKMFGEQSKCPERVFNNNLCPPLWIKMMQMDPDQRISAKDALRDDYFTDM